MTPVVCSSNSIFVKISIFLLVICQSSNNAYAELLHLNDQTLHELYYQNLANTLVIKNEHNGLNVSLNSIQEKLNSPSSLLAKSIEISNFNNLFKRCVNESIAVCDIAELFFPHGYEPDAQNKLELAIGSGEINFNNFQLECLNLSGNSLTENFLDVNRPQSPRVQHSASYTDIYIHLVLEYFSHLRLLKLSNNNFKHLERKHLVLFQGTPERHSKLETLLFNSNKISSIRHDTFYNLKHLKHLDLANNRLKIIHPLTFSVPDSQLMLLNLKSNQLRTVFYTPIFKYNNTNSTGQQSLPNLKFLYLQGNQDFQCNCGLLWLYHSQADINLDNFTCTYTDPNESAGVNQTLVSNTIPFSSINNGSILEHACAEPNLYVNEDSLEQTSSFTLFRGWSNRWFDWTLLVDKLPVTTPFPYLMSDEKMEEVNSGLEEFNKYIDYLNRNDTVENVSSSLEDQEKHVFHTWRTSDVVFDCTNKDPSGRDETNSTIIWKTQHGYFSFLDKDLTNSLNSFLNEEFGIEDDSGKSIFNEEFANSFKIFYQLNKLTRIYNNLTIKVGQFDSASYSNYLVNSQNQLIVTNMRQIVAGPFVCISINEKGLKTYEYDIHVRVGIDEYFIYCLFVSVLSGFIPSMISLVICCVCEYKAARDYNIIRHYTCHPTPMAGTTPPNFDFNDWVANAASYLPNIKIQDTLDQVSKKLRKGMGKASVAVKTLGMTSSAYIYSVYENSTMRWSEMKGYVPTLNVPTLTMPTMRYPPMGQIANRMRMGMGNMLFQVKEFCGSSDLNHTISIGDLEMETNASNAVGGQMFIFDKIDKNRSDKEQQRQNQFQSFLNFLREESRSMNRYKKPRPAHNSINEASGSGGQNEERNSHMNVDMDSNEIQPSTSSGASAMDDMTVVALPKLNMIITFSNANGDIEKIEKLPAGDDYEDEDFDDEYGVDELRKNNEFNKKLYAQAKEEASNQNDISFIDE